MTHQSPNTTDRDEIDLIALIKSIWAEKHTIVKLTALFTLLGILIAFTSPKEYEAYSILIPEATSPDVNIGGSLGGLASLAGINLKGSGSSANTFINPGLYRSVAQSTPFLMELINKEFYFNEYKKEMDLIEYYENHYKSGLLSKLLIIPNKIRSWFRSSIELESEDFQQSTLVFLSEKELGIIEDLRERILVTMDWSLHVVTIEVEMQDPVVSAEIARFTQEYITEYVKKYALTKINEQLSYVESQYEIKKREYEDAQLALANYKDQNKYVNTARTKFEEEQLASKARLAYNVYNQLAQQLEQVKLKVSEQTPVFTVLEPVMVPVLKSKPRRVFLITIFAFFGTMSSIFYLIARKLI